MSVIISNTTPINDLVLIDQIDGLHDLYLVLKIDRQASELHRYADPIG